MNNNKSAVTVDVYAIAAGAKAPVVGPFTETHTTPWGVVTISFVGRAIKTRKASWVDSKVVSVQIPDGAVRVPAPDGVTIHIVQKGRERDYEHAQLGMIRYGLNTACCAVDTSTGYCGLLDRD